MMSSFEDKRYYVYRHTTKAYTHPDIRHEEEVKEKVTEVDDMEEVEVDKEEMEREWWSLTFGVKDDFGLRYTLGRLERQERIID